MIDFIYREHDNAYLWLVNFYRMTLRSFYRSESIRSENDRHFSTKIDYRAINFAGDFRRKPGYSFSICGRRKKGWKISSQEYSWYLETLVSRRKIMPYLSTHLHASKCSARTCRTGTAAFSLSLSFSLLYFMILPSYKPSLFLIPLSFFLPLLVLPSFHLPLRYMYRAQV